MQIAQCAELIHLGESNNIHERIRNIVKEYLNSFNELVAFNDIDSLKGDVEGFKQGVIAEIARMGGDRRSSLKLLNEALKDIGKESEVKESEVNEKDSTLVEPRLIEKKTVKVISLAMSAENWEWLDKHGDPSDAINGLVSKAIKSSQNKEKLAWRGVVYNK